MNFKTEGCEAKGFNDFSNGCVNSLGFNSDLSSPVESVVNLGEAESDEGDFITGLTRKLVHSTLENSSFDSGNAKEALRTHELKDEKKLILYEGISVYGKYLFVCAVCQMHLAPKEGISFMLVQYSL